MEEDIRLRHTGTAQTDRKLFKYPGGESVLGKHQEHDVPLHEPHSRNKLKLGVKE